MADLAAAPSSAPTSSPSSAPSSAPSASPAGSQSATAAPAQGSASPSVPGQPGATTATPPPRFYKQKVNGTEREIPAEHIDRAAEALGLSPEEFLQASQLKAAAYQRFEAAEKMRKDAEAMRAALAKDPWAALRQAGADPDALAVARIQEMIRAEQMTPEQRRIAELEEQTKKFETEKQTAARQQAEAQRAQETQVHVQRFHQEIPAAMEAAGLPRTPEAARMVLAHAMKAAQLGLPVDIAWAAKDAAAELTAKYSKVFAGMSPERLIAALGQPAIDALQKHLIARVQTPTPQPTLKPPVNGTPKPRPYGLTPDEWRERFRG